MTQITLVRHGQANSEARDELSYDRLSALGHEQARWLGGHFDTSGERFARVYSGSLRRHRETAEGIGASAHAPVTIDPRFDEVRYFDLAEQALRQYGRAYPTDREEFSDHLPWLFGLWRDGKLDRVPETFADFQNRIRSAMTEIGAGAGRAMVVTSGGVIAMAIAQVLGLDLAAQSRVSLSIMNTSLHRFQPIAGTLSMTQFNAVPHLEHPERQFAQTHL
jgi:broad specificity phosphatase PhoE